jgi:Alpha amylase, catalytic domain
MTAWPTHPVIYEINTVIWLRELSDRFRRRVSLGDVPAEVWDEIALPGVDAVWLMGVWERSPAGLQISLHNDALLASFREALHDLLPEDIVGSPYCVRNYVVDSTLGGPDALAAARAELAVRGVRLVLDYVPNHVAPDHRWVTEHSDYFVQGSREEAEQSPDAFLATNGSVLARGRDPYFPPWPDVVQLNAFSDGLRSAAIDTLSTIGDQADGVRCDMAMLFINDVFAGTWGERVGEVPRAEFWPQVIARVKERHPEMLFMAEAYWDLEWALQQQGFDYCYDKRLYDRLLHEGVDSVRGHLWADLDYQGRLVRFLENHDEPRAAATFSPEVERAAAVTIATLPGATLWHEGQFEGRRVRPPVFLSRRPDEPLDEDLAKWYRNLVATVRTTGVRSGRWQLLSSAGWPDDQSHRNLLAWSWSQGDRRHVVVVNLSDAPAHGLVPLPWSELRGRDWRLSDVLGGATYQRKGDELADPGLFVALDRWGWHFLALEEASLLPTA